MRVARARAHGARDVGEFVEPEGGGRRPGGVGGAVFGDARAHGLGGVVGAAAQPVHGDAVEVGELVERFRGGLADVALEAREAAGIDPDVLFDLAESQAAIPAGCEQTVSLAHTAPLYPVVWTDDQRVLSKGLTGLYF